VTSLSRGRNKKTHKARDAEHELHGVLSKDDDLNGVDFRVFLYLSSRLDFEEFSCVPQTEIADSLRKDRTNVSRSIRKLKDRGVIIPGGKVGRSPEWRLNAEYKSPAPQNKARRVR
jgi:predicted transcriptional regulator